MDAKKARKAAQDESGASGSGGASAGATQTWKAVLTRTIFAWMAGQIAAERQEQETPALPILPYISGRFLGSLP